MSDSLPTMTLQPSAFIDQICAKHSAGWKTLEDDPAVDGEPMLEFVPFLLDGEGYVRGDVMRWRAREMDSGPAGQHHLERLLHCAQDIPVELQKFLLVFLDTLWELPDGTTRVPCLIYSYIGWILVSRLLGRDQFGQARWGYNALVARVQQAGSSSQLKVRLKRWPPQHIDGLEVFEIEVDGDDPRWLGIDPKQYRHPSITDTGHFLVKPGKRVVKYVLLPSRECPSIVEVIDDIARRNLTRPDRAIAETILDARSAECLKQPIMGICGAFRFDSHYKFVVGYVIEYAHGRYLSLDSLEDGWDRRCQFVAVVSDEVHCATIDSKSPSIFAHDKRNQGWKLVKEGPQVDSGSILELVRIFPEGAHYGDYNFSGRKKIDGSAGQHSAELILQQPDTIPVEWREFTLAFPDTIWEGQLENNSIKTWLVPCLRWGYDNSDEWTLFFWPADGEWSGNTCEVRIGEVEKT